MNCFICAARGLVNAVRTERNMRVHLAAAFYVIVCGLITKLEPWEWAAVLICIMLVISAECFNTAAECLCDKVHPSRAPEIAFVKDIAAGGVLVCAAVSAIVGAAVFFRMKMIRALFSYLLSHPVVFILLVLTVPAWIYFIFKRRNTDDKQNRNDGRRRPPERGKIHACERTRRRKNRHSVAETADNAQPYIRSVRKE